MASVLLSRREARSGRLPPSCIVCGERTSFVKTKVMKWHPQGLYFLLLLGIAGIILLAVLASVLQKKMRLEAPLCRKHHNHWLVRNLVIGLSFLAIFLMSIGLFVLAAIQEQRRGGDAFFGLACGGTVVSLLAWLILTAILSMTTVRAKEITEDEMHLTGVSAEFADALAEIPYVDDEDDDYDRPRRRRERRAPPRYEDDPDERRSRRPPPRDDRVYDDEDQPRARGTPPDAFEERD